ncbi:MAG: hypothetical protein ACTS77_02770 [Arsenophonus sp. NC-TX2-MAG3]
MPVPLMLKVALLKEINTGSEYQKSRRRVFDNEAQKRLINEVHAGGAFLPTWIMTIGYDESTIKSPFIPAVNLNANG